MNPKTTKVAQPVVNIPLLNASYIIPPSPGGLAAADEVRTSLRGMLLRRQKGPAYLEPICGRLTADNLKYSIDWGVQTGDLQDLRNRMGLPCPPDTRFLEVEVPKCSSGGRRQDIQDYMHKIYNERSMATRPYFQDPYGRDTPTGRVVLMSGPSRHSVGTGSDKTSAGSRHSKLNENYKQTREVTMEETAAGGENEGQEDTLLWSSWALGGDYMSPLGTPPKSLRSRTRNKFSKVRPRVYDARNVKPKSEWSCCVEKEMARSRKRDIEGLRFKNFEKHKQHREIVRIQKAEQDASHYKKLIENISGKEERSAKAKAQAKAQAPNNRKC